MGVNCERVCILNKHKMLVYLIYIILPVQFIQDFSIKGKFLSSFFYLGGKLIYFQGSFQRLIKLFRVSLKFHERLGKVF